MRGVEDHVRFMGEMFWTMCVTMRVHFQFSQDCPSLYLSPNMQFSTCAGSDNESCDLLNRKGWLKKSVLLATAERKDVHCGITCSGYMWSRGGYPLQCWDLGPGMDFSSSVRALQVKNAKLLTQKFYSWESLPKETINTADKDHLPKNACSSVISNKLNSPR